MSDYKHENINKFLLQEIKEFDNAFNARLAYEKNCIAKYDYPKGHPRNGSKYPIKGERMEDFAIKFSTTIQAMKDYSVEVAVDNELKRLGLE